MKSNKELLSNFREMIGKWNRCFFKLTNERDCYGEIEAVNENFLQFCPEFDEPWESCEYEKNYEDESIQFIQIPLGDIDLNNLFYWNTQSFCWTNARWDIEQECWLHNETTPGSIPMPDWLLKDALGDDSCLKAVGYWQSDGWSVYFPHPKYLVEPEWRESERDRIIAYLRAGHECGHWCGYSYCRFGCFSPKNYENLSQIERGNLMKGIKEMGCRDLTDGEWVWPEGLAHYVEKHNVCLPDLFISTMQKNSWLVPQSINFQHRSEVGVCSSYWIKWAIEYTRTKQK